MVAYNARAVHPQVVVPALADGMKKSPQQMVCCGLLGFSALRESCLTMLLRFRSHQMHYSADQLPLRGEVWQYRRNDGMKNERRNSHSGKEEA